MKKISLLFLTVFVSYSLALDNISPAQESRNAHAKMAKELEPQIKDLKQKLLKALKQKPQNKKSLADLQKRFSAAEAGKKAHEKMVKEFDALIKKQHDEIKNQKDSEQKAKAAKKTQEDLSRLSQNRDQELGPQFARAQELLKLVNSALDTLSTPLAYAGSLPGIAERLYNNSLELYKMPREIFGAEQRDALRRKLAGLDYRDIDQDWQKKFNSIMRSLGGAPKPIVALEQKGERVNRFQKEFNDAISLLPNIEPTNRDFDAHIKRILSLASMLLRSDSLAADSAKVLSSLEEVDYARLPEYNQEQFNDLLEKHGRKGKPIISESKQNSILDERKKAEDEKIRQEKKEADEKEAARNSIALKNEQGEDFEGKKTIIDLREIEDAIELEPLRVILDEKQKQGKRFLVGRVFSKSVDGKEYIQYYEANNIEGWLKSGKNSDPKTRGQITNIQYFLFHPAKRVFNYTGDTKIKNYIGHDENVLKKQNYLQEMIKASA